MSRGTLDRTRDGRSDRGTRLNRKYYQTHAEPQEQSSACRIGTYSSCRDFARRLQCVVRLLLRIEEGLHSFLQLLDQL
jgi:hypothetical protein